MFTRAIFPLELRERVSSHVDKLYPNIDGQNISLTFNRSIRLDLSKSDVAHRSIIFNGFYELHLSKAITRLGRNGGILVDVGANYGYFSCLWAAQNPDNKVYAFEASPLNVAPLRNNVSKNALTPQIEIVPVALGWHKGKLNFSLGTEEQQTGWGGFTIDNASDTIEVDVDTLDNYAAQHKIQKINVLKIDTEGADTWVLYGAEKLLQQKSIKNIFFECNMSRMKLLNISENEAQSFLEDLGYVVLKESSTDYYAYPR